MIMPKMIFAAITTCVLQDLPPPPPPPPPGLLMPIDSGIGLLLCVGLLIGIYAIYSNKKKKLTN